MEKEAESCHANATAISKDATEVQMVFFLARLDGEDGKGKREEGAQANTATGLGWGRGCSTGECVTYGYNYGYCVAPPLRADDKPNMAAP